MALRSEAVFSASLCWIVFERREGQIGSASKVQKARNFVAVSMFPTPKDHYWESTSAPWQIHVQDLTLNKGAEGSQTHIFFCWNFLWLAGSWCFTVSLFLTSFSAMEEIKYLASEDHLLLQTLCGEEKLLVWVVVGAQASLRMSSSSLTPSEFSLHWFPQGVQLSFCSKQEQKLLLWDWRLQGITERFGNPSIFFHEDFSVLGCFQRLWGPKSPKQF